MVIGGPVAPAAIGVLVEQVFALQVQPVPVMDTSVSPEGSISDT
jgi:hypothetical protein